ncbi:MAG: amidase, partial [bacterium]|nr:amidase [bacterium]
MASWAYQSAVELLSAMDRNELTSVELLDLLLARIERWNGELNAVVTLAVEDARERASQADAARARGESWGPLHGLPMTVKECIEVAGQPTTAGAPELTEHLPTEDADTVRRLKDAGAIIFGGTNLPIYAGDFQSYNEVYGTTNNPWNTERGPGGSSGGSAASLAAGFTPLELGSDIGGSIRNPAHFCGVYGHKPSYGIVSGRGHVPGPPGQRSRADLAVLGPLARTPDDLALAMDLLVGPVKEDATAWRVELPAPRHDRLEDYRVALLLDLPGRPVSTAVREQIRTAADALAANGVTVDEAALPEIDFEESHERYLRLLYGVMGTGFPPKVIAGMEAAAAGLAPDDRSPEAQLIRGSVGPHRRWLVDHEGREHMRARWAEFFESHDLLLCPISPTTAFPHDHSPIPNRTLQVDDQQIPYMEQVFWAGIATLAYLPATIVPVGLADDGLPVGMQLIGPYLEDRTPIEFARQIEAVVGGFQ